MADGEEIVRRRGERLVDFMRQRRRHVGQRIRGGCCARLVQPRLELALFAEIAEEAYERAVRRHARSRKSVSSTEYSIVLAPSFEFGPTPSDFASPVRM